MKMVHTALFETLVCHKMHNFQISLSLYRKREITYSHSFHMLKNKIGLPVSPGQARL